MTKDKATSDAGRFLEAFDFAAVMAEKEKEHDEQMRSLLLSFLEVADSFDRFFAQAEEVKAEEAYGQSSRLGTIRLIRKQFDLALQKAGATPIACFGSVVDPAIHEIVDVKEMADEEEDLIVEEVRRGYLWKGNLLRRSQVITSVKPKEEH